MRHPEYVPFKKIVPDQDVDHVVIYPRASHDPCAMHASDGSFRCQQVLFPAFVHVYPVLSFSLHGGQSYPLSVTGCDIVCKRKKVTSGWRLPFLMAEQLLSGSIQRIGPFSLLFSISICFIGNCYAFVECRRGAVASGMKNRTARPCLFWCGYWCGL